jgi:DNA (cytosine-5)-methyltransferase 1
MNGLDLFSGIGGISYALRQYVKPIAYCEKDLFCRGVLLSRIAEGDLGNAPIWDDIRTLDAREFCNFVDIIYGGFPCQDISLAGSGKGLEGERSSLFYEMHRLAKEIKPKFWFIENVPAITSRGGLEVVRQIAKLGYDCRWCIISAKEVGASHQRKRWFLLAHSRYNQSTRLPGRKKTKKSVSLLYGEHLPKDEWKKTVSEMGKCTDGIPFCMDRIKSLGNAVVPIQAKKAFEILMGIKNEIE